MQYRELFTVEILHDYFTDGRARRMLCVPTAAGQKALAEAGLLVKMHLNRLYVFAPTLDGLTPLRAIPPSADFSFYVQPGDPDFFQYTQLPINATDGLRYYFNNLTATTVGGVKYLPPKNALFDAAQAYSVGQFVRNGSDDCHECLVNLAPNTADLSNAAQWRKLSKVVYADATHRKAFAGPDLSLPVNPAANDVTVEVFAFNPVSGLCDLPRKTEVYSYEKPVSVQAVSLGLLPEGVYRLSVNGVDHERFVSPPGDWCDQLGVIQIFHHPTVPVGNRLLDGSGQFKSPVFTIRMAPLSTLWQYVARTAAVKKVYDETTGGIVFDPSGDRRFCSQLPVRLQEKPYDKIAAEYNNTDDPTKKIDLKRLAVPGFRHKKMLERNATKYLLTETFLNY